MPAPSEFSVEAVRACSPRDEQLFTSFVESHRIEESLFACNPWMTPPDQSRPLAWGAGGYWDTTVARRHPYWRNVDLPQATKDLRRMRHDFRTWGYCLIDEGLSVHQHARMRTRLYEQAAGERLAGIEQQSPYGQYVNTLVNKGECFARCIEHDPDAVQAGPLIEQLLDETLGSGWICHAFLANGADPGRYPQGLHIDQGALIPWIPPEAPALVNTMFMLDDVDDRNGGTLMIPGSHRALIEAVRSGGEVGPLPPPFNLEARGGTIMVFDGRLLHGTGANRSEAQRFVATMSCIKPWMRQQENWILSVKPELLRRASPKLLHRMGFQAVFNGGTVEGHGINYASGALGDPWGDVRTFRLRVDEGRYLRVGELSALSSVRELQAPFTLREAMDAAKALSPRGVTPLGEPFHAPS